MSVDYNNAATLLHIVYTVNQWPTLKGIHDLAMSELIVINKAAQVDLDNLAKIEAKRLADEQAKANEPKAPVPQGLGALPAAQHDLSDDRRA